eukprot:1160938-Pelagomonas_calceolata.AAC.4
MWLAKPGKDSSEHNLARHDPCQNIGKSSTDMMQGYACITVLEGNVDDPVHANHNKSNTGMMQLLAGYACCARISNLEGEVDDPVHASPSEWHGVRILLAQQQNLAEGRQDRSALH